MEYIVLAVIFFQFILIIYMDAQNRSERELLQRKLMSKDLADYVVSTEEPKDSVKEGDSPYVDPFDIGVDQIINAKETQ